jgi:hypothetical protein
MVSGAETQTVGNCAAKNHGPYLRQKNFIEASIFGKIKKEREMGFVNVDFMVVFLKATITIVVIAIAKIIPAVAGNEY